MKKNRRRSYLRELVGHALNDGANAVGDFYDGARPSLVYPKCDANLVPYEELSLYIFYADLNTRRIRPAEFDNDGLVGFVYLMDRARHVHVLPFQNSYPISCVPQLVFEG